jgi:aspartate kinase
MFLAERWEARAVARIVMKFGGTSMAGTERIRRVARIVKRQQEAGHEVAVVVSAMAGETDRLVNFCREASALYDPAEYDVVVAAGEQITAGLLAMHLQALGCKARSWLGWQLPVHSDDAHAKARIESVGAEALSAAMAAGEIAVIPGFQGLSDDGRITTLGRGGSDTSAVAVAAAIKADRCDIYTDVDGVYTTDPRIVAKARKLRHVTYEEMLELASVGSKVLQTRSVSLAMKEGVRVQVLSSFIDDDAPAADTIPGTMIISDEELDRMQEGQDMESQLITGIAADKNEAKVTLTGVPDHPGGVATIFGQLAEANINVDMIIQNIAQDKGETDVTFTCPQADLARTQAVLEERKEGIGYDRMIADSKVAKISVVGVGMRSHAGVAATMFKALADRGINIQAISTSEIKVSVLIDEDETELAVRVLHTAYGLDAE